MSSLRILHAIRSDGYAGVERFVARLALAQADAGHAVHVVGGDEPRMRPELDRQGIGFTPAIRAQDVAWAVRRHRRDVDVVNTHMTAADLAAAVALWGDCRRPAFVATRHFSRPRGTLGPLRYDRIVERIVDAEIAISRAVAESIGVPASVVHSGVPVQPPVTSPRERTVLVAQRLQPEKRTDVALLAFAESGIAAEGWRLQVAGDGRELDSLVALTHSLGIDASVTFLGFRSDVPDLMRRAGILLAPCPVEGLGLSVLEAMALGLPVVAARAGGHIELLEALDPRSLFSPHDAGDAGGRLRSLAADAEARAALGIAVRARQLAAFSVDGQVKGTDAVYRAALQARSARVRP